MTKFQTRGIKDVTRLIETVERMLNQGEPIAESEALNLAERFIAFYDQVCGCYVTKQRAERLVFRLSRQFHSVLALVGQNAAEYRKTLDIDDAFPIAPNSLEVLADLSAENALAATLLSQLTRHEHACMLVAHSSN